MGKIIALVIVAVLGLGVWQWVSGIFEGSTLESCMQDVADLGKNYEQSEAERKMVELAKAKGISLQSKDVRAQITLGGAQGIPANLVAKGGISTSSKRLILDVDQHYEVLKMPMTSTHHYERVYTMSAQMPMRSYEGGQ